MEANIEDNNVAHKNKRNVVKDGPHHAILLPTSATDEFAVILFDVETGKHNTAATHNIINMVTKHQSVITVPNLYMNKERKKITLMDMIQTLDRGINGHTYKDLDVIHAVVHTKSMYLPQQAAAMKSKQGRMIYKVDIRSTSRNDESACLNALGFNGEYYNPSTILESYELTDDQLMASLPSFSKEFVESFAQKAAIKCKNNLFKDTGADTCALDGVEITANVAVKNFSNLQVESYAIKYGDFTGIERTAIGIRALYFKSIEPKKREKKLDPNKRRAGIEEIAKISGTAPGGNRVRLTMTGDLFSIGVVYRTAVAMTKVRTRLVLICHCDMCDTFHSSMKHCRMSQSNAFRVPPCLCRHKSNAFRAQGRTGSPRIPYRRSRRSILHWRSLKRQSVGQTASSSSLKMRRQWMWFATRFLLPRKTRLCLRSRGSTSFKFSRLAIQIPRRMPSLKCLTKLQWKWILGSLHCVMQLQTT